MNIKSSSFLSRWMISPLEIVAIVVVIILTIGAMAASVQDAIQLEEAINLNLTETLIINQRIVNLQRELQLTHIQVTRLLGNLDKPPQSISRFVFAEDQAKTLIAEIESPSVQYVFQQSDLVQIRRLQVNPPVIKALIKNFETANTPEDRISTLIKIDNQLTAMEAQVKELIDLFTAEQRDAMIHTRDSLRASQTTSMISGVVLLVMSIVLAFLFRRSLLSRLNNVMQADQLKSQLLTSVSHELRTPINAIQGYSQLLSEGAYGDLTDGQKTTMRRIQLNITQLHGMVNNLLDRAQLEQGKLTLRVAPFSPGDFLETSHTALNILATSKGLKLTNEIAPNVPAQINGDVLRLQQILLNLTSNALKFTETGGVHVRIFLPDATHWTLEVIDTGIGIDPDLQAHIFAPFWQADSSITREYRGSGLGLSIVKQLTDLMGGSITVVSAPGKGSTFTITFPLETA